MTPLPPPLGKGDIHGWRIDQQPFHASWDSGEGAYRVGGRWNNPGTRVVYCALNPSTAILEVAVHKTFRILDTSPHVLTSFHVHDPALIHVVKPEDVPNPNWLRPGTPGAGQRAFGDEMLTRHRFLLMPSAVSNRSWNLFFDPARASGAYTIVAQETFALDTRLHP